MSWIVNDYLHNQKRKKFFESQAKIFITSYKTEHMMLYVKIYYVHKYIYNPLFNILMLQYDNVGINIQYISHYITGHFSINHNILQYFNILKNIVLP